MYYECSRIRGIFCVGLMLLASGCGGTDSHETADVQGKVVFNGQPVADAVVGFTPQAANAGGEPGKSASGRTDASGTFTLSTYEIGDGAVVGKHQVTVSSEDPQKPLPGKVPSDLILEVKPGTNTFEIELVP